MALWKITLKGPKGSKVTVKVDNVPDGMSEADVAAAVQARVPDIEQNTGVQLLDMETGQRGVEGYHGTPNELYGDFDSGSYFAPNSEYAGRYAKPLDPDAPDPRPAVYPVEVDLDGVVDTRTGEGKALWDEYTADRVEWTTKHESGLPDHNDEDRFTSWLMDEKGMDPSGIWVDENNGETALRVFKPDQISSRFSGFAPGAVIPAAVIAGAALTPEEAQAAKVPVSRLLDLGILKTPEAATNPSAVKSARTKYEKALKNSRGFADREARAAAGDYATDVTPADLPPKQVISPEEVQGSVLVPVRGDQSTIGTINQVGGIELPDGVPVEGGYQFGLQHQGENRGWASAEAVARGAHGKLQRVAEQTDRPVVGVYNTMGRDSVNFSTPIAETMQVQVQHSPRITKADKLAFDSELRALYPDWVGLDSPDAMNQLMGEGGFPRIGKLRTAYSTIMGKAAYRDRGFPSYNEAVAAATSPDLAGSGVGESGLSMYRAATDQPVAAFDAHKTYDTAMPGEYIGGLEESIPFEQMFPEPYQTQRSRMTSGKGGPQPLTHDQAVVAANIRGDEFQIADQRWVDNVMRYQEQQKQRGSANPALLGGLATVAGGLAAAGYSGESEAGTLSSAAKNYAKYMANRSWPDADTARAYLRQKITADNEKGWGTPIDPGIVDEFNFVRRGNEVGISQRGLAAPRAPLQILDEPTGNAAPVNWDAPDLQDIRTEYPVTGSGYMDADQIPQARLAGGRTQYDWSELQSGGEPPPVQVKLNPNGSVSILDGNHRLQYYRDQGYDQIPVRYADTRNTTSGVNVAAPVAVGTAAAAAALAPGEAEAGPLADRFRPDQFAPIQVGEQPQITPETQRADAINADLAQLRTQALERYRQAPRTFSGDMRGLAGLGEMMGRGLGGMALGGVKAIWDLAGGAEFDDAVAEIDRLTGWAMEGFSPDPVQQIDIEHTLQQTRRNAESVLPAGAVDAYLQGLVPYADQANQYLLDQGVDPRLAAGVGATIQAGEILMP